MYWYLILFVFVLLAGGILINSFCKSRDKDEKKDHKDDQE